MSLKRGLSFVAFGFLFTLVNINLQFEGQASLDLFPDFLGWFLLLLAYNHLLRYTVDKPVLKWLPLPMIVYTGIIWLMNLAGRSLDLGYLSFLPLLIELFYLYTLFGCLYRLAAEHVPELAPRVRLLRNLNLGLTAVLAVLAFLTYALQSSELALLVFIGGIVALGVAVYTCVLLFQLRSRVPE